VFLLGGALALVLAPAALRVKAQQSTPAAASQTAPESSSPSATRQQPVPAPVESVPSKAPASAGTTQPSEAGEISEDQLRKLLEGRDLFLRGGYLDNSLTFNEHGVLIGHSPQGSYTLSGIRITKVRLLKHKVELQGQRYGLHFLGSLPYEDPTKAVDRVDITPKKKEVRITIDRELVVKPKSQKGKGKGAPHAAKPVPAAASPAPVPLTAGPVAPGSVTSPASGTETTDADEAQAEIAKAPAAERPADAKSITTTISPAHANKVLEEALDNVFARGFDARMMAAMPGFWQLYYDAANAKADYRPKDPDVLRQSTVDQKARLVTTSEPASNQFAQDYGVAGMSEYHVVVGADGKPGEIAVARPIGFGLDESAVETIRKAAFEPAIKDGKPVPVMLDMVFEFRIYSRRTAAAASPAANQAPEPPPLPGPYSAQH
jgi:TonB family protein